MRPYNDDMIEFFEDAVYNELENQTGTTYWQTLGYDDEDNQFAIVLGWRDCGLDGYELCMKLAYLPANSGMSEYDFDWLMPYDKETMKVDDTEITVGSSGEVRDIVCYLADHYDTYYNN